MVLIKDHMQDLVLIIILQLVLMTRISNLQNFFLVLITIYKYCEIQKKGKKKKLDNLLFLLNFNKK